MKFLLPIEVIKAYGPEITLFWKKAYKDGSEIKWRVFITVNEIRDILVGKADTESEAEKMIDLLIKVVEVEEEKWDKVEAIHEKFGMLLEDLPYQETKVKRVADEEVEKLRETINYLNQEIHIKNNAIEELKQNLKHRTFAHYETQSDLKKAQARERFNGVQYRKLQEQLSSLLDEKETLNSPLMNFIAILVLVFAAVGLAFVIANFAGAVTWKW
jgi:DNA repair exonuclease SbcCD ATPase subunit